MRVLIIRLSALGDVAILLPLLQSYAQANPTVQFVVAGPPLLQPLFDGITNVEYLGLKKQQPAVNIYRSLQAVDADIVLDLHRVNRVVRAIYLLRFHNLFNLRFHIYTLHKGRLSRWLFLHHFSRRPRRSQFERYDDVFRRAGLLSSDTTTSAPSFPLSTFHFPLSTPTIGFAPFAQHQAKIWPADFSQSLISLLIERGYNVILFGSKEEAPLLQQWVDNSNQHLTLNTPHLTHPTVRSLAGQLSFAQEIEEIKKLTLMVSMDSANMHFASAVGTPVISIWGATHPDFGFYGYGQPRSLALCAGLQCQPCSAFGQKACRFGDYRCLRAIKPLDVLAKIEEFLSAKAKSQS